MTAAAPDVYDHLRPTDEDDAGVYRVVGTGDAVTLLRVADADGRRVATGALRTVPRDALGAFEPAENPDAGRSVVAAVGSAATAGYWTLRTAGPLMLAGVALAITGTLGNVGLLPLPALVVTGLIFAGFGCILIAIVSG